MHLHMVNWNAKAPEIMKKGLLAKFQQNESLKKFLLDTGDTTLVECNPTDEIWSCGLHMGHRDRFDRRLWKGTNLLGRLLEEVRAELA